MSNRLTKQLDDAKKWANKNLVGKKVFNKEINDYVFFNKDGVNHAIFSKTYPEKIEITYSILKLIETAVLYSKEKDKKNRPDIKAVYKLVNKWSNKGKEYFIYIVVRETKSGKFFYDHGIAKEKP